MAAIKPDSAWITATMEMFLAAGLALGCGAGCLVHVHAYVEEKEHSARP